MAELYDMKTILGEHFVRTFTRRSCKGDFGCREWRGLRSIEGYGTVRINGLSHVAHRVAWIIHHRRPIPADLVVDHLCCNKGCVNPKHLEAVTAGTNMARINNPPPNWLPTGEGTRRRYQTQAERTRIERELRRQQLEELPDRPVGASIRIRNGNYQVRWRQRRDGQWCQRSRTFGSKEDAELFIASLWCIA
jgi:hypothetical protein